MQKQRSRNANAGYAKDFVSLMREILPDCVEKNIKVLSNAGGVNVEGCANSIADVAKEIGLSGKVKIGVVTGDDILPRLDEFLEKGFEIKIDWGGSLYHYEIQYNFRCKEKKIYLYKVKTESFSTKNPDSGNYLDKKETKVTKIEPNLPIEKFVMTDYLQ